ncbi:hypothetical protein BDM02DRAFT_3157274 [Thelephora ganbajun]|uniref:Uncharacterized protein n=1 Tax=Thelephora ganbajun TaxID=370292 RepID=A0ACB6Z3K5_THEGA|nr:hypothetical protein BDM02DRAFT_3157274 [Thelephora ganbajun]
MSQNLTSPPDANIPISETDPRNWRYIAEGGSTIVFSYDGPRNFYIDGTVVRLRKSPLLPSDLTPPTSTGKAGQDADDPTVDFQEHVISRLVPAEFLPRLEHVQVERGWLEKMVSIHDEKRPAKRRAMDGIDLNRTRAVLATDLIGDKGWAVEIKPKWGFKPNTAFLAPASRSVKSRVCRFCMKKYADKKTHPGAHVPAYCPLELYSPDPERVKKALYALWDDWVQSNGTINMLRIFVNGKVLDPSKVNAVSLSNPRQTLSESSAEVLAGQIDPDHAFSPYTLSSDLRTKFAETVMLILMDHPALPKLSELQGSLDSLDIEGLSALVTGKTATEYPNEPLPLLDMPEVQTEDPTLDEWRRFLNAYFHHKPDDGLTAPTDFRAFTHGMSQKRYYMLAYLLSASFKDCSIIIRGHEDNVKSATVTIIDLDSKSLGRMRKWENLDRDVVKCEGKLGASTQRWESMKENTNRPEWCTCLAVLGQRNITTDMAEGERT